MLEFVYHERGLRSFREKLHDRHSVDASYLYTNYCTFIQDYATTVSMLYLAGYFLGDAAHSGPARTDYALAAGRTILYF